MIMVSLHPFAFRKMLVVVAVIWLAATVVFADPVLMNARAERFARHSLVTNSTAYVAAKTPRTNARTAPGRDVVGQTTIVPAEGPIAAPLVFEQIDSWSQLTRRPVDTDADVTFWANSLSR